MFNEDFTIAFTISVIMTTLSKLIYLSDKKPDRGLATIIYIEMLITMLSMI